MNRELIRDFYLVAFAAITWLFLLTIVGRFERLKAIPLLPFMLGPVAVLLCFVPVGGVPLWAAAYGVWTNPSLPLLGLVVAGLGERLFGVTLFQPADRRAVWIFGAVAGTILYLNATLMGGVDLYYFGWDRRVAIGCLAVATIAFLGFGNRAGVLLLAAMIVFSFGVLESLNLWDYVIDPFLWLIGLGASAREGIGRLRSHGRQTEVRGGAGSPSRPGF